MLRAAINFLSQAVLHLAPSSPSPSQKNKGVLIPEEISELILKEVCKDPQSVISLAQVNSGFRARLHVQASFMRDILKIRSQSTLTDKESLFNKILARTYETSDAGTPLLFDEAWRQRAASIDKGTIDTPRKTCASIR